MINMDQNTDFLDPCYLHILTPTPVLAVAGAINGDSIGAVKWFCQIGYNRNVRYKNVMEAKQDLEQVAVKFNVRGEVVDATLVYFCSAASIQEFAQSETCHVGRFKKCSRLSLGKCILLGDAAAPFPPIGQGINAGMESAMVLDQCIGALLLESENEQQTLSGGTSKLGFPQISVCELGKMYTAQWKPEVDAVTEISSRLIYGDKLCEIKSAIQLILGAVSGLALDPLTLSKKSGLSYTKALEHASWRWKALQLGSTIAAMAAVWAFFM
jgi:hypothetical protein